MKSCKKESLKDLMLFDKDPFHFFNMTSFSFEFLNFIYKNRDKEFKLIKEHVFAKYPQTELSKSLASIAIYGMNRRRAILFNDNWKNFLIEIEKAKFFKEL